MTNLAEILAGLGFAAVVGYGVISKDIKNHPENYESGPQQILRGIASTDSSSKTTTPATASIAPIASWYGAEFRGEEVRGEYIVRDNKGQEIYRAANESVARETSDLVERANAALRADPNASGTPVIDALRAISPVLRESTLGLRVGAAAIEPPAGADGLILERELREGKAIYDMWDRARQPAPAPSKPPTILPTLPPTTPEPAPMPGPDHPDDSYVSSDAYRG